MSYRLGFLLLLGTFLLLFSRVLFRGEVIFPHNNALEAGLRERGVDKYLSNRKFSDQSSAFIPELANNLSPRHKAWLNTWNPHVELGRPASHISGLSRAYLLTNFLAFFSDDPLVVYTGLVLLTVGLTSCFGLLFFRALGLHPAAGLSAAFGLGCGTALFYWLTFVMFLSAICWSLCLLWLITEFIRQGSWPRAIGLAFATYSLLLTGYPQMTVLMGYMIAGHTLLQLGQRGDSPTGKACCALALLGCAVAGGVAALPVYLDLFSAAQNSARLAAVSDNFFLAVLPPHHGLRDSANFLLTISDWSWLGNAIAPEYPLSFNGLSFTPVFASLIWLSFWMKVGRGVWYWRLFLLSCAAATISPAIYLFAVRHLGFGFSRIQLLCGAIVPGFVLAGYAIDAVVRGDFRLTSWSTGWLFLPLAAEAAAAFSIWRLLPLHPLAVGATCLFVLALVGAVRWRASWAFVGLAIVSTLFYAEPLILSRPPSTIHRSSELTQALGEHAAGSRYAIADPAIKSALPPNEEVVFGLKSINSYNSLSARRYQELVSRWSEDGPSTYGRHFRIIQVERALADPGFSLANVGLILSTERLTDSGLKPIGAAGEIKLYRPAIAPVDLRQSVILEPLLNDEMTLDLNESADNLSPRRLAQWDDFQKIAVSVSPQESLLFVSQQYDRAWRATTGSRRLRTVLVNHFYQGVIIPPFTSEVELRFQPWAWWSWLPQVVFAGMAVLLVLGFGLAGRDKSAGFS